LSIAIASDRLMVVANGGPLSGAEQQRALAALYPETPPLEQRLRERGGAVVIWRLPVGRLKPLSIRQIAQAAQLPEGSRLRISALAPAVVDWGGGEPATAVTEGDETTWRLRLDEAPDEIKVGWEPPAALQAGAAFAFLSAWIGVITGPILVSLFQRRKRMVAGIQIWPVAFAMGLATAQAMLYLPVFAWILSRYQTEALLAFSTWFQDYYTEAALSILVALVLMWFSTLGAVGPRALINPLVPKRRLKKVSRELAKEFNRRTRLITVGTCLSMLFLIPLFQWVLQPNPKDNMSVAAIISASVFYICIAAMINHGLNTQESLLLEAKYKES
jgi:hypothetical protein